MFSWWTINRSKALAVSGAVCSLSGLVAAGCVFFFFFSYYILSLCLIDPFSIVITLIITKTSLIKVFKSTKNFTSTNWQFTDINSDNFHISAQNIDCGYSLEPPWRGGSNEYRQLLFLSRNNKNNVYPCKPQFYSVKVGFNSVNII